MEWEEEEEVVERRGVGGRGGGQIKTFLATGVG